MRECKKRKTTKHTKETGLNISCISWFKKGLGPTAPQGFAEIDFAHLVLAELPVLYWTVYPHS